VPIGSTERPFSQGLGRRYFLRIALLIVVLVVTSGAVEAYFAGQEARRQVARLQALQVQATRAEVEQYLESVLRGLQQVQALPWGQSGFGPDRRHAEWRRLLALNPALIDIVDVDDQGRERLAVSRTDLDRVDDGRPVAPPAVTQPDHPTIDTPFFDQAGAPLARLRLPARAPATPRVAATLNLRFLGDVASRLRVEHDGAVYVVDGADQLIAHADPTQALRRLNVGSHSSVQAARRALASGATLLEALDAPGLDGQPSLTTAIALPSTGWLVFVQQPLAQALAPVAATLQRTLLLVAVAVMMGMLASAAFARRMAAPIARLRQATADMAAGQLDQRLDVRTGDEIQGLAEDFNAMSERLQQSYRELESKVEQRTAELALRRDEAERANAAKTRFLASASHDLRQPMHAIGLLVELLRVRVQAPEQRDLADKTHQAVLSMEALFGSLLDISKLDAGAVQPQVQPFALQALLDRVQATHAPLAQAKGLRLRVRPTPLHTDTDPALLERILGNLVSNAIRYTHTGGVLVGCRRRGDRVALQVVDTGVGIAADQRETVFEEFVRLGEGAPGDQGLGLGLAIVRRTAQLLGLPVALQSRPGRGSVFEVLLPVVAPAAGPPIAASDGAVARISGAFVLLVDDDATNLQAGAALLRDWGCLVATAHDAGSALAEAARHLRSPDVIVTDLRLGSGEHGLALVRRLRAQCGSCVPALLVTADVQLPLPVDGDVQVLRKPCGADRLRGALALALAGPAVAEPLAGR
jgi:signal transduction histidine kinase/CheY-like chemotaxis protein